MRFVMLVLTVLALAVSAPAIADRGGNANGGNGQGNANAVGGNGSEDGGHAGPSRFTGTLTATPDVLHAGDYFDVSGCGYDTSYGNVIVGFTGGSWGSRLDSSGCFTLPGIPALSGDTLPPGTYPVTAYQDVDGRLHETGETTVTVVE
jgi:hypothetical protein